MRRYLSKIALVHYVFNDTPILQLSILAVPHERLSRCYRPLDS